MSTVTFPEGLVWARSLATEEILTGDRSAQFRYELLTRTEAFKGILAGAGESGHLEYSAYATIKGAGSMVVTDLGQDIDFYNDRVRPFILIDGLPEQPLGIFTFAEAPAQWSDTGRAWSIGLLDKTAILEYDCVDVAYGLDAGTVVTSAIVDLIESAGETNYAVTPSGAVLLHPQVWDPGTSKLRIINDLLDTINYFSLYADLTGQLRADPYLRPAQRPIRWEFLDGQKSIYSPDFVVDMDLLVPNKYIAVSEGAGGDEALVGVATNEDPGSRYSYPSRGRWIAQVEEGVETTDQATLDAYARRRLIEASSPTSSVEVVHAYVPGLLFNDAVRFRRVPAGIDSRHVVSKTRVSLDPSEPARSTLTEVVDL